MLHKLWTRLTGWHAYQMRENTSYRAIFFTRPEDQEYHDAPHVQIQIPFKPGVKIGAQLEINGEDDLSGYIALGYQFFFSISSLLPWSLKAKLANFFDKNTRHGQGQRSFKAVFYTDEDSDGWWLCFDFYRDDHSSNRDDNKKAPWNGNGWHWMFDLKKAIFGDWVIIKQPEHTKRYLRWVSMPEGKYPAIVEVRQSVLVREHRLWLTKHYPDLLPPTEYSANVKLLAPISAPGKGENSWDLDDSQLYEISFGYKAESPWIPGLLEKTSQSRMRDRERHGGGYGFVPDKGWPPYMVPHGQPEILHPDLVSLLPRDIQVED